MWTYWQALTKAQQRQAWNDFEEVRQNHEQLEYKVEHGEVTEIRRKYK